MCNLICSIITVGYAICISTNNTASKVPMFTKMRRCRERCPNKWFMEEPYISFLILLINIHNCYWKKNITDKHIYYLRKQLSRLAQVVHYEEGNNIPEGVSHLNPCCCLPPPNLRGRPKRHKGRGLLLLLLNPHCIGVNGSCSLITRKWVRVLNKSEWD